MGEVFSWENGAEYSSVVEGAGPAGPRRKFKIAAWDHKYLHNHTKKTARKQPGPENRPGMLLDQLELQRFAGGVMLSSGEFEAMVPFPITVSLTMASFSDKRHIYAGPYGGLLSYISEIIDIPLQGGNEVWDECF